MCLKTSFSKYLVKKVETDFAEHLFSTVKQNLHSCGPLGLMSSINPIKFQLIRIGTVDSKSI